MRLRSLVIAALPIVLASAAHARGYRPDQVPGGVEFECYMCHYREPFVRLTVFGIAVRETLLFRDDYPEELPQGFFIGPEGNVDWPTVALLDSDGDGYTNGEELGDPEGLFVQFGEQPDFPFTRPDLPEDFPCGSGTVEGPEQCDGAAFADAVCADFGFTGGVLTCRDDCTIDTARCTVCGDGVVEPGEQCEGQGEAPCDNGADDVMRCVACAFDRAACVLPDAALPDVAPPDMTPPDMTPPDAAVDVALPDAMPDAMADAMVDSDAMPDVMNGSDAMPDAMPDAITDRDMASVPDADPPDAPAAGEGCVQGPPPAGGAGLLLGLALLLIRRRR